MAVQLLSEKLEIGTEKNILIQGLPSSIEKQFVKVPFAKSVTPLLRSRRIDFALVFSINKKQLANILNDVIPALAPNSKFWIAYPKPAAKIVSDLSHECDWDCLSELGFTVEQHENLDSVWTATRFTAIVPQKAATTSNAKTIPELKQNGSLNTKISVKANHLQTV